MGVVFSARAGLEMLLCPRMSVLDEDKEIEADPHEKAPLLGDQRI